MAFTKPPVKTPVAIGAVRLVSVERVTIDRPLNPTVAGFSFHAEIELLGANNQVVDIFQVDVESHLTTNQINGLKNLLGAIRTKATAELL